MSQTSLSVWFVCKLCRGSFGQVDAFIEHKKQKHFTQFQNTTSIVFEERELGPLYPVITSDGDHQLADEINESSIKVEVNNTDPIIPFSSEIIDEPISALVEPKSEIITSEYEINADSENNYLDLKQPEQNPYVLIKQLTSDEIQNACVPQHHSTLFKCEQKNSKKRPQPRCSLDTCNKIINDSEVEKCTEIQPTANVRISTEHDLQFECKLCSKQFQSEAQLKIHVGICALHHEDRNRFCVICNQKLSHKYSLEGHRLRFHGTEEEKLSIYKFKCHLCGIKLRCNAELQKHIATVHLGVKAFSCSFPNCNKAFSQRSNLERHFLIHTGERPFKCTVDNCDKAFTTSANRSLHHLRVHSPL